MGFFNRKKTDDEIDYLADPDWEIVEQSSTENPKPWPDDYALIDTIFSLKFRNKKTGQLKGVFRVLFADDEE